MVGGHPLRHLDLVQMLQGGVDGSVVHLDDLLRLLAVGLLDRVLNLGYRLVLGQHTRDREEAGLQDGVGAVAQTHLAGHGQGVDGPQVEVLLEDLTLHGVRQLVPHLVGVIGGVQQDGGALASHRQDVDGLQDSPGMDTDESGLADEVRGLDRVGSEAQVGGRPRSGLLGVVDEVALGVGVGV